MIIHGVEVEDTYAEGFKGVYARFMITAGNFKYLRRAVENIQALPSVVIGRAEGGVEKYLKPNQTIDGRVGSIVQVWGVFDDKNPDKSLRKFEKELSYRIRQGVLVVPTTSIFNALNSDKKIDMMGSVGHYGDGYEYEDIVYDRRVIKIPIMMDEFLIERYLGYGFGVAGISLWFFCKDLNSALRISEKALRAVRKVEGVVTPFKVCSAGSKPETKYPEIGPTTNHPYCPTLRERLGIESRVPANVNSIPEIVINGVNVDVIEKALAKAIKSVLNMDGLVKISAANYGGKLGQYRIYLREVIERYL